MTKSISRNQVWRQKKGQVSIRIDYFCKSYQCPTITQESHAWGKDHAHVVGWNNTTMVPTNHNIITAATLFQHYEVVG